MDIYKEASRLQLRVNTSKGLLSVEQLWTLSQTDLSNCIKNVKKELKKSEDDDLAFLDSSVTVDPLTQLTFDILKDIYLSKKAQAEEIRNEANKKAHNEKILALIAEKKEASLQSLPEEELMKMLID